MAYRTTIYLHPVDVVPLGLAQAAGMPGEFRFDFKTQDNLAVPNMTTYNPQMVLRPFTQSGAHGYDIVIDDPTGGSGVATVPGSVLNDRFTVEVYARSPEGQPWGLLASGRFDLNGYAYHRSGPLGPATYSTGPSGPAGPVGATGAPGPSGSPGMRGSRWYTAPGTPSMVPDDRVPGDMYLNETNGDVWRWDGAAWTAFKGT